MKKTKESKRTAYPWQIRTNQVYRHWLRRGQTLTAALTLTEDRNRSLMIKMMMIVSDGEYLTTSNIK